MIYLRRKNFSQVQPKNYNVQYIIQPIQVNDWLAWMLEMGHPSAKSKHQ